MPSFLVPAVVILFLPFLSAAVYAQTGAPRRPHVTSSATSNLTGCAFEARREKICLWVNGLKDMPAHGWQQVRERTRGYLMPFLSVDRNLLARDKAYGFLDSWLCWDCAWPQTNADIDVHMDILGEGRYATSLSPWFFSHFDYKGTYYRGDDWLLLTRWEELVDMRNDLTFVEMVTWNDFGESSYFGPINPDETQPSGTTWATGFPHTGFFDLSAYYIQAFKTGEYPAITEDIIYFRLRPHPAGVTAFDDPLPKPEHWDWAVDRLWVAAFCADSCTVTLQVGSYSQEFDNLSHGVNKLSIPLKSYGSVTVKMSRDGEDVIDYTPSDFEYRGSTIACLYLSLLRASPAKAKSLVEDTFPVEGDSSWL
ncbi:glycosyl hydrolase family 71-domain-containing protein [Rhodocollybia butyracea]|uniref:Glycosyl hydrolase family 71-domain-containing protein n=1 Tax=Rhodocollybia butyracea TaxID=206335 RepID=A0A9P5PTH1_9AGAR|nr:glycosyl hydrolase family 71-domain-containing protein [Rhodocollybia butyracea]